LRFKSSEASYWDLRTGNSARTDYEKQF